MGTINGTLKLLNDNLFSEQEIKIEGLFKDDINNEIEIKNYRIVRRNIRRTLDSQPRMGINFKLYKARYNHNIVAEKVYQDIDPQFLKGIQQEVLKWIQQRANNYVAWVHGLWVEGSSIGIVSDYFEAGSLQQLVSKHANEGTEIDLLTRLRFTHNIIEAVANLHSIGIIHGGLNPRNLLVTSNLTLQFGGFETIQLRLLGEGREAYYPYTPPEILEKEDPTSGLFTKKGDVYSLGMILGSIWTTSFPYDIPEPSDSLSLKKSILEGTKPIWVKNLSGPTLSFIERCIDMNPEIRPTSYEMEKEMRSIFTNGTTLLNSPNSLNPTKSKSTIDPLLLNEPSLDYSYDYYSGYSLSPKPYMNFDSATSLSSLIDGFKSMHISTPKRIESLSPNASPALNQDVLEFPNIAYNESVSSTQTSKDTNLTLNTSLLSNLTQDEVLSPGSGISLSDAIYFHNTQQYEKAYAYFLYLSEVEGKAEAIYYIGLYHYTGKPGFLAPNLHLALSYLQRAAKGGCGDAYDYLGLHYLDSGPDFAKAFSHFHAAARHLSSPGCYHLSQCYKNGHGTNIDPELALYNLQLAASLGYGPAKNMLEQEMQLNSRHLYKIEERSSEAPDIVIEDTSN
ncbi:kinase-like protein [Neoconidiobolus thromboides FSU 785]|nr:kinase-like protein [Neoconidiobolus thromboides FSU 785]